MSNIALCDNGNIELCDDGNISLLAPSTCPCEDWLPASWPCGGLAEKYTGTNPMNSAVDSTPIFAYRYYKNSSAGVCYLTEMRHVATTEYIANDERFPCRWYTNPSYLEWRRWENRDEQWGPWTLVTDWSIVAGNIRLNRCRWELNPIRTLGVAHKYGLTPAGYYYNVIESPDHPNGIADMLETTIAEAT